MHMTAMTTPVKNRTGRLVAGPAVNNERGSSVTYTHRRPRLGALLGLGGALALGLAAGLLPAGVSGASKGGLPAKIHIYSIQDASGAAGAVGVFDEKAINLAIKKINATHMLGKSTISISYGDSATTPTTAANLATQAVSAHYPVVIGPPSSGTAVAVAPIFSRAKEPIVFTQAGGPGTVISKYTFRMTPLQTTRIHYTFKWLKSKRVKTVGVLYNTTFPTEAALYKETAATGPKYGFKVVSGVGVQVTQSNISAQVTQLLASHPQAVCLDVVLTANATAATLLKQAGFTGPVCAEDGAGGGSLAGAGTAANGVTWASDWVAGAPFGKASTAFTKAWKAAYGSSSTPPDWAAESYTAMIYIAKALKKADSTSPTKVAAALAQVGAKGYAGVLGKHIVVKKGQQDARPVLVQWLTGKEVPLATQNP